MRCHSCQAELSEGARFCSTCGASNAAPDVTVQKPPSSKSSARTSAAAASGSLKHGRFLPGTILGERFRIVALLGRGGMGEVFRADDVKLGQPVALKFLPPEMATDRERLERLYNEVRVARQIAHPNVCRVYDVGEVDGEHFISMEYIEGEDLATLLRRIGRLPEPKAIQISRQVAAGIAAAHEKGVLHRDLKPSNIMLDERGLARITDFGLAAVHTEIGPANVSEGTPAYMAPEQLTGREVSTRSDIYSLGLVLYELFTGKQAFDGKSAAEVIRQRQESTTPSAPSSVVADVNPAVERLIIQCLDPEPGNRPASTLAVAAALPGGDPLAAALAAGETPSPELLAAAGASVGISPVHAFACVIAVILAIIVVAAANDYGGFSAIYKLPRAPEQLVARSREVAARLGYKEQRFSAFGFGTDSAFSKYLQQHDQSATRWSRLSKGHPTGVYFWYRESPRPLVPIGFFSDGKVSEDDPPLDISGMVSVAVQPDGVLEEFHAVSPQLAEDAPPKPVDWKPLLDFAAIDAARAKQAKSTWTPLTWGDLRAAWTTQSPEQPDIAMRLEAAAFQGKTVAFQEVFPWSKPARDVTTGDRTAAERIAAISILIIVAGLLLLAAFLARRNFRLGRGDRRGAFRFALVLASLRFVSAMLKADHVFAAGEFVIILSSLSAALLIAAIGWLLYIGIEPYVRRRWPQTLVSWNRLILGQLRDPLVGRDVLIGLTAGTVLLAAAISATVLAHGKPGINTSLLTGMRAAIGGLLGVIALSLVNAVGTYVLIFALRIITRRDWIAAAVFVLINSVPVALLVPEKRVLVLIVTLVANGVAMFLLFRFGIVVLVAWNIAALVLSSAPLTLHLGAWYSGTALFCAVALMALTIYAFRLSLAGRPLFTDALFET